MLYPLKFKTQFKDKIWGGQKIKTVLKKDFSPLPNCGETWEISGVAGNISEVANGTLKGQNLIQVIDQFKDALVGQKVYQKHGSDFPLLIKFIDANDDLSVQVHPNDALAKARHNSFGKTEMWYIFQADPGALINAGFSKKVDKETYKKHVSSNTLNEILNMESVTAGDTFFTPAGRVHYLGKGVLLAEIQQTSDITYRIYDFDRVDDKGQKRELHTDLAVDALDFEVYPQYKTPYQPTKNAPVTIADCPYFHTNLLELNTTIERDYKNQDSFVIYICFEGSLCIQTSETSTDVATGECILLPAAIKQVKLVPNGACKLLECWVP